ncbi:MAG: DUF1622 domain-containing protein [Myxococcaceae bacterium]
MKFLDAVAWAAELLEGAGVLSMLLGALFALVRAIQVWRKESGSDAFRSFRENLGRAILLGLEFLVAADIVRTVVEAPTLLNVSVLGLIVVIRTFLSFTLQVELEGVWPWRRGLPAHTKPRHSEEPSD